MSRQTDLQRARRQRREGLTGPRRAQRERERQAELLIAQVLTALAQRDSLVAELEARAGRCLAEIKALGWPPSRAAADACGISVQEVVRLRSLADKTRESVDLSEPPPTLDAAKAGD